ncbi:MAG: hypothetical protein ABII26_06295, partial [Pseudomonadota bacterium]
VEDLRRIEFLKKLQVVAKLKDMSIRLPLSKDSSVRVSRIHTPGPLKLTLMSGLKEGRVEGEIVLEQVHEIPFVGPFDPPIKVGLSFLGTQENLRTLQFTETMHVTKVKSPSLPNALKKEGLRLSAQVSLSKIDHLLTEGLKSPLSALLRQMEGTARGEIRAEIHEDLNAQMEGLSLRGGFETGAEVQLAGGKEVKTKGWFESPGLNIRLGDFLQIANLKSQLDLEKRYGLVESWERDSTRVAGQLPLSSEVLRPVVQSRSLSEGRGDIIGRLMEDLKGRLRSRRALSMDRMRVRAGAINLEISNQEMEFRVVNGMPLIDHFQWDMLGGTVLGSITVAQKKKSFSLETNCSFSGLNANRLLPDLIKGVPDKEAELTGQVSFLLPLSVDPRGVLHNLEAHVELSQIGSRALERFLYAVDPFESHETITHQRNLLRTGSPRWIRLKIRNGNLSVSGEIDVKGIRMELPAIERFNMANLPVQKGLEEAFSKLVPVVNLLEIMAADGIRIEPDGTIRFVNIDGVKEYKGIGVLE